MGNNYGTGRRGVAQSPGRTGRLLSSDPPEVERRIEYSKPVVGTPERLPFATKLKVTTSVGQKSGSAGNTKSSKKNATVFCMKKMI